MTGIVDDPVADGLDSWEHTYVSYFVSTVRLAGLLVGDFHLGEDIAQDAIARLLVARRQVSDPPAYLRRTVLNLCRSHLRRTILARRHRDAQRVEAPALMSATK